jgi:hypothetical protein
MREDDDKPAATTVKRDAPPAAPPVLEARPATEETPTRSPEPEVRER